MFTSSVGKLRNTLDETIDKILKIQKSNKCSYMDLADMHNSFDLCFKKTVLII